MYLLLPGDQFTRYFQLHGAKYTNAAFVIFFKLWLFPSKLAPRRDCVYLFGVFLLTVVFKTNKDEDTGTEKCGDPSYRMLKQVVGVAQMECADQKIQSQT